MSAGPPAIAGTGRYEEAISEYRSIGEVPGIAINLALLGRHQEARELLEELLQGDHGYIGPGLFSRVYLALGDKETAIEYLTQAVEAHSRTIGQIRTFHFAGLESDPRYQALVERIGLPPR